MLELIKSVLFLSKHCSLGLKLQPFYFSCNTSDSYPLEILVTSLLNTIPVCSLSLLPPPFEKFKSTRRADNTCCNSLSPSNC